jgi:hypothetical protein
MRHTSETRSLSEIPEADLEALERELGLVGMIRYLQRVSPGKGDYTAERAALVGHLTVDEICDAIEKRQQEKVEGDQDS